MKYVFNKRNFESKMIREGITRKDLASSLGISYTTINTRINGKSQWYYSECLKIKETFFPEQKIDELFQFTMINPQANEIKINKDAKCSNF